MLAQWMGVEPAKLQYTCVGVNHQAFYLELKADGKNVYPLLREAVKRPEVAAEEPVRLEMFRHLGYFSTESSGHNSEYNPWFRKRADLIEQYCTHGTGWNPGQYAYILKEYLDREGTWEREYNEWLEHGAVELERGEEYAYNIFNAMFGDHTPYPFNANLRNHGYITNIDEGACVEVPVHSDEEGIHPLGRHTLPQHLDILVSTTAKIEELAVRAAIEGDPRKVFQAILFDPLTASVCSMEEIHGMVQEMLTKNAPYLGYFQSLEL
jgi:alpha-galactosidase